MSEVITMGCCHKHLQSDIPCREQGLPQVIENATTCAKPLTLSTYSLAGSLRGEVPKGCSHDLDWYNRVNVDPLLAVFQDHLLVNLHFKFTSDGIFR